MTFLLERQPHPRWILAVSEEIIFLGPCPAEEQAAQLGDPDYARDAKTQCRAYIQAIREVCGREPEGARLVVTPQLHDFGQYFEVCVRFDPENEAAVRYASHCDQTSPTTWEAAGMTDPLLDRGREV